MPQGPRSPPRSRARLTALAPSHIYLLGGTGVVSAGIATTLATSFPSATITRYGGADRYETSALIAADAAFVTGSPAFVATGANFPDALSGAALAGTLHGPILLVPAGNTIPASINTVIGTLAPSKFFVLGGTGVVSTTIEGLLAAY